MTGKGIRRFLAAAGAVLLCAMLLLPAFTPAAEAAGGTRRIVRVGIPDADTVSSSGGENRTVVFMKEYLQAVAEYANWDYVYVEAPWSKCVEMVRSGDIDVLLAVSKTDERMGWFNYSSESMGTEMCYLYARGDTSLQFNDFKSFNGLRVGYEAGSTNIETLRAYGKQKGFSVEAVPYETGAAMFQALDAGEVDTVAQTNFYDTPAGHVILAKCGPSPIYIVTSKADPALKNEVDDAMSQLLSFDPSFNASMFKANFGTAASEHVGYTAAELAYLKTKPVVYFYYEQDWKPFEYESGGRAAGITPDVIRAIEKDTGIRFQFALTSSTQDVYSGVSSNPKDVVMAVSYDYLWANAHDLRVTQPYVTGSCIRVTKSRDVTPKTVAVVKDGYLASQVAEHYPGLAPADYLTPEACMDAVRRGEADCTFISYYQAINFRNASAYANLSYQPDEDLEQDISLGVTRGSDPALFGILSKSLQRLSAGKIQGILNKDSMLSQPLSLSLLMRRYPAQMALLLGFIGVLAGLLAFLLVSSSARQRKSEQLAAAKLAADEANDAKSEFLSRMSHDMRTPLNGIIGMTYLTSRLDLPEEARGNLRKIDTSSRFLLSLINDVLDMSKAESGKIELHPEPYPPEEFGQYIDAVIRPLCEEKNQTFTAEVDMPENCVPLMDKLRINQIVFNLLSNAVKYTPEGGEIRYSSHSRLLPDGRLAMHVEVRDNGIGMSEKFQQTLFDPFTQESRDDNSEIRGSGLGLAITKRLVDLMGGDISVSSEIGKGSVFAVDLTLGCAGEEQSGAAPESEEVRQPAALAGRHILLCEDHPLNQEIARALLTDRGALVEVAEDGANGVSIFSRSSVGYYDAILMDIRMPVMDGYEATRRIRALERPDAKTVPIIAMTADAFADDVQRCTDAGMNGHLAKPIEPALLYDTLRSFLRTRNG